MRKAIYIAILLVVAASIAAPASCGGPGGPSGDVISGTGTVKFVELEGGFYGIVADDGKQYDPINLGKEFQQDGLKVKFEAKVRTDVASIRMWGTIVEITKMERVG